MWPSTVGCKWAHLLVFSPQSHLTCEDRDFRMARQCWHCDTGRPFLLICCSGRSAIGSDTVSSSSVQSGRRGGKATRVDTAAGRWPVSWGGNIAKPTARGNKAGQYGSQRLTRVLAVADAVAANAGLACPFLAVDYHVDRL